MEAILKLYSHERKLAIFVIDDENIKRLKKGRPIHVNLAEMGGPDHEVVIHWSDDFEATTRQLEEIFTITKTTDLTDKKAWQ